LHREAEYKKAWEVKYDLDAYEHETGPVQKEVQERYEGKMNNWA
jgi:hypothetical protein